MHLCRPGPNHLCRPGPNHQSLGLETLRHGTNPVSYVGIALFGGNPSHGGTAIASTSGWASDKEIANTKGYFYMFKDSEFGSSTGTWLAKRVFPLAHSFLSGYNFTATFFSLNNNDNTSIVITVCGVFFGTIGGIISVLITPIAKFRFNKIDPTRLINDQDYDVAYKTQQKVEFWRNGLLGTIFTGINFEWYERASANPAQIFTGVIQLTAGVALGVLAAGTLLVSPAPAIVGALLAY
jgi:hypothetical protein